MPQNEVESKARNVAQRSWESVPILNGEQPGAVEDFEVALNDPGCVARAHPTAALSDCGLFWLLHTLDGFAREGYTGYWTK